MATYTGVACTCWHLQWTYCMGLTSCCDLPRPATPFSPPPLILSTGLTDWLITGTSSMLIHRPMSSVTDTRGPTLRNATYATYTLRIRAMAVYATIRTLYVRIAAMRDSRSPLRRTSHYETQNNTDNITCKSACNPHTPQCRLDSCHVMRLHCLPMDVSAAVQRYSPTKSVIARPRCQSHLRAEIRNQKGLDEKAGA